MQKITKKITGFKVVESSEVKEDKEPTIPEITFLAQGEQILPSKPILKRPLRLDNEWRLKPPYAKHALYVRLNAITHAGKKYPYEIFFNTKDVKDIKWLNALTVTISTAFRTAIETGSSLQTLIDNFKESCDTESPYLSRVPEKPKFVNGLVAEIGLVIEEFAKECLERCEESSGARELREQLEFVQLLTEHTKEYESKKTVITNPCPQCGEQLIKQAGCEVCVSCDYSKCG